MSSFNDIVTGIDETFGSSGQLLVLAIVIVLAVVFVALLVSRSVTGDSSG